MTDAPADGWPCPCCGGVSTDCYRCSECGHELTGDGSSAGRMGGER
ncbi:hypothetical protein [Halonotius terrestris]|nr:hypothetical protein [Halonotius terrestris]